MLDAFVNSFASSSGFMPHGYGFLWTPSLFWTYVVSDSAIAASYFSTLFVLWHIVRRRPDFPFRFVFMLFGAFVLACGATRLNGLWDIWHPDYWVAASLNAVTAIVSAVTAFILWAKMTGIVTIPTHAQLERANRELQDEVARRVRVEAELRAAHDALEQRVAERTAELETTNKSLGGSEKRYRAITQSARLAVVTSDSAGAIVGWNQGAKNIFGYMESEATEQPVTLLMPPSYYALYRAEMDRLISGGDLPMTGTPIELKGVRRDKSEFPMELSLAMWDTGEGRFFTGIIHDITERKRAEEAVRDSEEGLRAIFEGALDGILVSDPQGRRFLSANPAICTMLGYTLGELVGLGVADIHREQDMPRAMKNFERLVRGEIDLAVDVPLIRGDGSVFYADIRTSHIRLGGKDCLLGIFRDNTERKRAEAERAQLAAIVEASDDAILSLDLNGILLTWNAAAERMFGYGAVEVVGRNVEFLIPTEEREVVKSRRALTGRGVSMPLIETVRIAKDGRRIDVAVTRSVIREVGGKPVAVSLIMRDIGERKRAETALARQRDLYNALSQTDQVIVRGATRDSLFNAVCRVAVEHGRFLFAWVGWIDAGSKRLKPAAKYGEDGGYVDRLDISVDEAVPAGRTRTAQAFRSGTHLIVNDFADQRLHPPSPAIEAASRAGARAFATFPIRQGGAVVGVINFYAAEADFFTDDLVATLVSIAQDVSFALDNLEREAARKLAEQARRESEQRFQQLAAATFEGLAFSERGRLVDLNAQLASMLGYEQREMIGRPIADFIAPEVRDLVSQKINTGDEEPYEHVLLRKDGSKVDVMSRAKLMPREGKQIRVTALVDLSYVRRAERTQAMFAAIVANTNDAIIGRGLDGNIIAWNAGAERMLGYTVAEVMGHPLPEIIPPDELNRVLANRKAIISGNSVQDRDAVRIAKDGRRVDVSVSVTRIDTGSGSRIGSAITLHDLTDRKRLEEARLNSQRLEALGTLASGIAHDFNNILAAIRGNADLAAEEVGESAAAVVSIAEIKKASARATDLVRRITAFGRPKTLRWDTVGLDHVVDEVLKLLRPTIPAGIELRTNFADGLPPVRADASQAHEALVNLSTNAAHAIGDRAGTIEFRTEAASLSGDVAERLGVESGDYVVITVKDDGIGMDEATQRRIFDAFFTTKPTGVGSGLGLSVVYGIMKGHAGAVSVQSEVGTGSSFHLYFPIAKEGAVLESATATTPARQSARPANVLRVMYVDDEDALVRLGNRVLERLGHTANGYSDPAKALEAFRANPHAYDVVITDLSMPMMSGVEFTRALRSVRSDILVILTTGNISAENAALARKAGISELLLKPVGMDQLGEAIERVSRGPVGCA